MKSNVIVFDLDDTLYKEKDFLLSAFKEIANWIEITYSVKDVFSFMLNIWNEGKDVFSTLIGYWNLPIQKGELLAMYRRHKPNINLDTETQELLENLVSQSLLGLITDGRSITQWNKIHALNLQNWMQKGDIVISEEFGSEKPSLDNFIYFQHRYPHARYIYVGDNTAKDFLAPNILGWETVCLLDNGENIHKQHFGLDKRYLPKYCIGNIKYCLTLLRGFQTEDY